MTLALGKCNGHGSHLYCWDQDKIYSIYKYFWCCSRV